MVVAMAWYLSAPIQSTFVALLWPLFASCNQSAVAAFAPPSHISRLHVPQNDAARLFAEPTTGLGDLPSEANKQLLSDFSKDLVQLSAIRPPDPSADQSAPIALISAGSSYTRLWTPLTWLKHADPPHVRYIRHIRRWPLSTSARKILPAVIISAIYSLVMSYIFRHAKIGKYQLNAATKGAAAALGSLSAPLALLLTLRANASLGRLNEARILWGACDSKRTKSSFYIEGICDAHRPGDCHISCTISFNTWMVHQGHGSERKCQ